MKTMIIKTAIFTLFCFITILVIACSENFIVTMSEPEEIVVNKNIGAISNLNIRTGYTDSTTIVVITVLNPELSYLLRNEGAPYNDSLNKRVKRYHLEWDEVSGADDYEVRIHTEEITENNWHLAKKAIQENVVSEDGKRSVIIPLVRPKVLTGRCVDCGECVKACPTGAIQTVNGKATIDYNKCIECGECYRACEYDAISGVFAGSEYYFAIRGYNNDNEYSNKIFCTNDAYLMRYTTLSSIPDSIKKYDVEGCKGNCDFGGCFITFPTNEICKSIDRKKSGNSKYGNAPNSVCPVDAIYSIGSDSIAIVKNSTIKDAIFIDKEKCINCGRCVAQCYDNGTYGSVTTEIIKK